MRGWGYDSQVRVNFQWGRPDVQKQRGWYLRKSNSIETRHRQRTNINLLQVASMFTYSTVRQSNCVGEQFETQAMVCAGFGSRTRQTSTGVSQSTIHQAYARWLMAPKRAAKPAVSQKAKTSDNAAPNEKSASVKKNKVGSLVAAWPLASKRLQPYPTHMWRSRNNDSVCRSGQGLVVHAVGKPSESK